MSDVDKSPAGYAKGAFNGSFKSTDFNSTRGKFKLDEMLYVGSKVLGLIRCF